MFGWESLIAAQIAIHAAAMRAEQAAYEAQRDLDRSRWGFDEYRTIDVEARFIDEPLLLTDCLA